MGVFCGLGAILLTHLTASEREPAAVRSRRRRRCRSSRSTLYFTFSRGGIAAAIAGVVAVSDPGASARSLGALPAVGAPGGVRAATARTDAELLAQFDYTGADARAQGRSLFVVVIAAWWPPGCCAGSRCGSTGGLVRASIGARSRTIAFGTAGVAALLALVVATVAFDLPGPDRRTSTARSSSGDDAARGPPTCARA